MNKTECQAVIDYFVGKIKCSKCSGDGYTSEHDLADPHENDCCTNCPIQVQCEHCEAKGFISASSVCIGDVLEKMDQIIPKDHETAWNDIITKWQPCGFTKSLNQIMDESGFEDAGYRCKICGYIGNKKALQDHVISTKITHIMHTRVELECPNARALFEFLKSINK